MRGSRSERHRGGGKVHDLSIRRLLVRTMLILRGETSRRALVPSGVASSFRAIALARRELAHTRRAGGGAGMQLALLKGTRHHTRPLPPYGGRTRERNHVTRPNEVPTPSFLNILVGVGVTLALLYWAKAVLIPVALALLLTFLLTPIVTTL